MGWGVGGGSVRVLGEEEMAGGRGGGEGGGGGKNYTIRWDASKLVRYHPVQGL